LRHIRALKQTRSAKKRMYTVDVLSLVLSPVSIQLGTIAILNK